MIKDIISWTGVVLYFLWVIAGTAKGFYNTIENIVLYTLGVVLIIMLIKMKE